jgi:thiol-disulfide isomerase/thioredoxin
MPDRTRIARAVTLIAASMLVVSACSGAAGPLQSSADPSRIPAGSQEVPATSGPSPDAASSAAPTASSAGGPVLDQSWATAGLVDVTTGETFRIADHAGQVIIIETMAIWCPSCRAQQNDVHAALDDLPADTVEYIVLDIDPSEQADSLAAYREDNRYTGTYAIAGPDVARALAGEFGDQVLNPPSTPIVIVGADGRVTLTDFGHKSVADIVALVQANGA